MDRLRDNCQRRIAEPRRSDPAVMRRSRWQARRYYEEGIMPDSPYDRAVARVDGDDRLRPHRAVLIRQYPEGDQHYDWVATTATATLIRWARWQQERDSR
jgi:hypothetical protein